MKNLSKRKIYLEILSGKNEGHHYTLSSQTLHMGRSHDNDIVIDDKRISRHHAQITFEEGDYYLIDLNTSNGTFINKQKILNQKLRSGDIIQIGHNVLRFVSPTQQQQHLASVEKSYVPQQEKISRDPASTQKQSSSIRPMLYGLAGVILILFAWLMMQNPSPKPEDTNRQTASEPTPVKANELPDIKPEEFSINFEKANQFYRSGYRELLAKNYLRAIDDFKAALELYPEHRLAQLYLGKTENEITEEVTLYYKSAINYFNSAQYKLAIYNFSQVTILLKNRRPPPGFCQAQAEQNLLENDDFEKYCQSLKKIDEAQTMLTED